MPVSQAVIRVARSPTVPDNLANVRQRLLFELAVVFKFLDFIFFTIILISFQQQIDKFGRKRTNRS
jgi:hypothetical protein